MSHATAPFICFLGLFAALSNAQQNKPNLSGKWQLNTRKSEVHSRIPYAVNLAMDQKGSAIHLVRTARTNAGRDTVTEFNCTTDGKDCDVKGVKISLWYDGASLVEMDIAVQSVTKSSMTLSDDGKTISIDVNYISPPGDREKLVLEKSGA
jgi:hypothetical protein